MAVEMRSDPNAPPELAGTFFVEPVGLPHLGSFSSGSSMRDYYVMTQEGYTITSYDYSGLPVSSAFQPPIDALPENVCINATRPRGLLHPRTYLLAFYRADALQRLHREGWAASASFPDDWEALLELLAAHKAAVEAPSAQSIDEGGSSGKPVAGALPSHGLCITTHDECGRLGDVWAAIAASIVQTTGTPQGVYWDLQAPPPSAKSLVNTTGWQYAADVLKRLLAYNVMDLNHLATTAAAAAAATAAGNGSAGGGSSDGGRNSSSTHST
ncbi:hypothetical protein GPECTOR_115g337 [Gonium pectorale]|uniref:Uncharacterized protein n=1 Tax=Gonium pectorale TaxID=33097 RepID=A0A150FZ04_GONPE|nr:hypothetical protein GPECTOR_115g337 [Gonium pectorale]|eukprot:KXZ42843.1 hypothetical protein GPECTOR_115g337 [Gonium pectorale]